MSDPVQLALWGLLTAAIVLALTAAVSRVIGRVSVVDVAWGLVFTAMTVVTAVIAVAADLGTTWRSWLLVGLVSVWGLRLAIHLAIKQAGHGEDPRYARMLRDRGFGTAVLRVFGLQALIAWVVCWPVFAGLGLEVRWGWVVWVGALVWAVGLAFEAIGDAQLAAYKRDAERGPIMDRGLWGWTRHPNYFGDALVWWGLWLAGAVASGWLPALVTLIAPVAMTHLLRNVSGAKLTERGMQDREGWAEYAARVPLFVPRPPRSGR